MLFAIEKVEVPTQNNTASPLTVKDVKADIKENFNVNLSELAKTMKLIDTSGPESFSNYASVDWSVNKKSYKHKVYFKVL